MATEPIDFDTKAMNALNDNIMKCLDGIKVSTKLSKALTPEERRLLARAADDYIKGHYNAAVTRYKTYVTSKPKLAVNSSEESRLDVIVQYLVCKCLLHSNQFQELTEAKTTLTELEASVGSTYPMVYYGLAQFYIAVFCFEEADQMSTKGLSVSNTGEFPVCYLPESKDVIKESTKDELTKLLLSLKEQCSGWHPPDARCFMTICKITSQNHLCGRDIFLKSPAYNGMVKLTCSNSTNPCEIHFHSACWKVKKDEASSIAKISDKEVVLNWECFTPNCGTEDEPSVIKKISIYKEDGSVKDIEPSLDKSTWHGQQHPSSSSKGAIRKQKHVSKISTAKVAKAKQLLDKNNETPGNDNPLAIISNPQGSDVLQSIVDVHVPAESPIICDPFTLKAMKMIALRELNFNVNVDNDWRPNKAYYGNEHMRSTIDTSYEPDFSEDTDNIASIKTFLFSYFLSLIENRGPIKNDDLMKEWRSLTDCSDFEPISKTLNDITQVRKFLLQSLKFVAIGNYICIPELLPGAYALNEEEAELKILDMIDKKTFDFGSMHLKRKKKSEAASDKPSGKVKSSGVSTIASAKAEPVDPFLLTADDFLDEPEEESDGEEYDDITSESSESLASDESCETPVKKTKCEEEFIDGERKEGSVKSKDDGIESGGAVEQNERGNNLVQYAEKSKQEQEVKNQVHKINNNSQSITKKYPIHPDEHIERYVVETESEGTLDDQDDLPWDGKTRPPTQGENWKKCEPCRCDKLPDLEATIATLEEELQSTRDELYKTSERLRMSEEQVQKTQENLRKTQTELHDTHEGLQNTLREALINSKTDLQKAREELKTEKQKFKELRRKTSREVLDSEFNHNHAVITSKIDQTQAQYAIVMKLQSLVHQTTKNYLSVDQAEWAVPLEKLEKMLSGLEEEHRRLTKLINSEKTQEHHSLITSITMRTVLPLPQRNIPELIEIAFNLLKNHYQSMVSYRAPMIPPGLAQVPQIMPLWYQQQPRYATPSIQSNPYHHHMINPMMTSSQYPSGYTRQAYIRPGLSRDVYSHYVGTPITITDVSQIRAATPPPPERPEKIINPKETVTKTPERTSESESSSSDKSEKMSVSTDKSTEQPPKNWKDIVDEISNLQKLVKDKLTESSDFNPTDVPEPVIELQQITNTLIDALTVRTPVVTPLSADKKITLAQIPVVASTVIPENSESKTPSSIVSSPMTVDPKKMIQVPKSPPPMKIPATVSHESEPASSESKTPIDPKKTIEAPRTSPSMKTKTVASALAASSLHPITKETSKVAEKVSSPTSQTVTKTATAPPLKKDPKASQVAKVPNPQVKKIVHEGLAKAKLSEQSTPPNQPQNPQVPGGSNEMPVNGIEIQRPKIQSLDKLMHILRDRHPGVLEFDLLWSIKIVRKNHNDSLTGMPLGQIIAEADKLINSRQKLQLIPYSSSNNKVVPVKSQGTPVNMFPGRSGNEANPSTPSVSSLHRDHLTKMNPWSKPQDVSWVKESTEAECVICWETLMTESNPAYTLKCQHTFHKACLVNWFVESRSCPTCRIHATIDDDFPPLP